MANEFVARNGIIALNNSIVTGSLDVTTNVTSPSFTGSLYGTSSWAESASIAANLQGGTQYYVPVWTDATTLGTSSLYDDGSVIKTVSGGVDIGLKLDFANNVYRLGYTDDNNRDGVYMDFNAGDYAFGAIDNGNKTFLLIADSGRQITTRSSESVDIGLGLDFANSRYSLGDYNNSSGSTSIIIDDNARVVTISGSTVISGSLNVSDNIIGSLQGTASFAQTASFAPNYVLTSATSSMSVATASFVQNAQSASYVLNAVSSSFATSSSLAQNALTASFVQNAISSSFASTASFAVSASWAPSQPPFPFSGAAQITGSLLINTGSLNINVAQKLIDLEADIIAFAIAL